jgi:hypothetical protein
MRCDNCASTGGREAYWPMTVEFWNPRASLTHCRACLLAMKRARERERYADKRKAAVAAARREYKSAWYAANRERIAAARRERYRLLCDALREVAA